MTYTIYFLGVQTAELKLPKKCLAEISQFHFVVVDKNLKMEITSATRESSRRGCFLANSTISPRNSEVVNNRFLPCLHTITK